MKPPPTVAVAISGGVDSLVAAWLLKKKGYEVVGVHFVTGFEGYHSTHLGYGLPDTEALAASARNHLAPIGDQLDIPIRILDGTRRFKKEVIEYFIETYRAGRTPSPCLVCNPTIKFGDLFAFGRQQGAGWLATGHYARIRRENKSVTLLRKGIDSQKDQSYFLARLTAAQLDRAKFPLGEMTKQKVIALAEREGLSPVTKGESQDICFIKEGNYKAFLAKHTNLNNTKGPIVNTEGTLLGYHSGLHQFTVGQRRGINCPGKTAYYVVEIDHPNNRLIVGKKAELLSLFCSVEAVNWINGAPINSFQAETKIRYRHEAFPATVIPGRDGSANVHFDKPQSAITPGQGAVFYQGDVVMGGGWITAGFRKVR